MDGKLKIQLINVKAKVELPTGASVISIIVMCGISLLYAVRGIKVESITKNISTFKHCSPKYASISTYSR